MISVVDYDAGNTLSVIKAVNFLKGSPILTADRDIILNSDAVILPGVGSFEHAMKSIKNQGLDKTITDFIETGKPFLGICLGLQLLFQESEESPGVFGLGIFKGKLKKIPRKADLKVPHIGWNSLGIKENSKLFKNISNGSYVYFVHSYFLQSKDRNIVSSQTDYGVKIDASIESKNIYATQFHPEKSGTIGISILKNFVDLATKREVL